MAESGKTYSVLHVVLDTGELLPRLVDAANWIPARVALRWAMGCSLFSGPQERRDRERKSKALDEAKAILTPTGIDLKDVAGRIKKGVKEASSLRKGRKSRSLA
jgi:hypothetical protein